MSFLKNGRGIIQKTGDLSLRGILAQLISVIALTLAYILLFQVLINHIGIIVSALLVIPVIMIGFYFGRFAGLVASLCGFVGVEEYL